MLASLRACSARGAPWSRRASPPFPICWPGSRSLWAFTPACSISGRKGNSIWAPWGRRWWGMRLPACPAGCICPWRLAAGVLGGALWGAIPGILKARLGAHEVINTIMMNYIAVKMVDYLVKNVFATRRRAWTARPMCWRPRNCPCSWASQERLHAGLLIALAAAALTAWLLFRATIGFAIRTVGANRLCGSLCGHARRRAHRPRHVTSRRPGRRWRGLAKCWGSTTRCPPPFRLDTALMRLRLHCSPSRTPSASCPQPCSGAVYAVARVPCKCAPACQSISSIWSRHLSSSASRRTRSCAGSTASSLASNLMRAARTTRLTPRRGPT